MLMDHCSMCYLCSAACASCMTFIILPPNFVASSNRGAKKSAVDKDVSINCTDRTYALDETPEPDEDGHIRWPHSPAVAWNRLRYRSKFPKLTHSLHPLAATTNSTSSGRCIRSLNPASIAEESNPLDRNRYSATPDQTTL